MEITVDRYFYSPICTVGKLAVDGSFQVFTLEDMRRAPGVKVPGATCIPAGVYVVKLLPSGRYHRLMPFILDVPDFRDIEIHPGNTVIDTRGCILVGLTVSQRASADERVLFQSKLAFDKIYPFFQRAHMAHEVMTIAVRDTQEYRS